MGKVWQFFWSESFKGFLVGMVCVVVLVAFGAYVIVSANSSVQSAASYSGQNPATFNAGQGPVGLLVSAPVEGCSTVDQIGLHTQDVPESKNFAYATNASGAFCAAVLYTHGKDVEISSSKPIAWAALYDVQTDGQHMSTGLVFSYGTSLIADNVLAASPSGASYHAVPVALYVFSLPSTDPVSLDTAEAALPQCFTSQGGYYPIIQIAGDYGLPSNVSIIYALVQNTPMK